jgi:hypothetical protein
MKRLVIFSLFLFVFEGKAQEAFITQTSETFEVRCYPNPTSDLLIVQSSVPIKTMQLIDLNGQVVKANPLPNNCFSMADLPNGWFFVYIENEAGEVVKKNVYKQ